MHEKSPEKSSLLNFLDETFRTGFFTHCFLETGFLDEATPKFRLIRAKDERQNIYDLASLTKALVTAPLCYRLLLTSSTEEANNLRLADLRDMDELPESIQQCKLTSLLAHRSGLAAWLNFWIERLSSSQNFDELLNSSHEHIVEVLHRRRIELQEGADCYSDVGFIILGFALEKYYGMPLHELFREYLHNLTDLEYGESMGFATPENWPKQGFISTAYCPIRERWLRGEVHDENAAALGGVAGHAGLFASGSKLSSFIRQSFSSTDGHLFWEENERRRRMGLPLIGLRKGDDTASKCFAGGEAMGHWGFTGTGFWVHIPSRRYAIILTNRVISSRCSAQTQPFRQKILGFMQHLSREPR
ncbi:MAG: serine hydrolase domain-containing protein [Oligoflexus sp.]